MSGIERPDAPPASGAAAEVFPPTLREVMLRPQWIGLLLLCLAVAALFAWLGQWQLGRAIDTNPPPAGATEQVRPLAEVSGPSQYLPEPLVGQRVSVTGTWMPGDFVIVSSRFNDDVEGYWVAGQLRIADTVQPTSIAVAIGWAPTMADAERAAAALEASTVADPDRAVDLVGRLISDEGPQPPPRNADPQTMTRMSPAALLARWNDVDGVDVYRPYLAVQQSPTASLVDISSPAPAERSNVNWLNIFYAVEWAVFAGFAFYLWYRLARDAWEKEVEDLEDAEEDGAPGSGEPGAAASGGDPGPAGDRAPRR